MQQLGAAGLKLLLLAACPYLIQGCDDSCSQANCQPKEVADDLVICNCCYADAKAHYQDC